MNFDIQIIQKHLAALEVGSAIHLFKEVTSTNDALRELAKAGAPEGTVVIADEQKAGHGRHGKPWFSPPGVNLYASVLFRPSIPPRDVAGFSFVASLALSDAIKAGGSTPRSNGRTTSWSTRRRWRGPSSSSPRSTREWTT